jgi:ABC-type sugar transport system permease subunit
VSSDLAFKYWAKNYRITYKSLLWAGALVNFKLHRFIYSHLFGKEHFNAAFDDPQTFFKPFTLTSIFAIVTSVLPLLVANICGLIFLEFGY